MSGVREWARRALGAGVAGGGVAVGAGKARTTDRFSLPPAEGEVSVERVTVDVKVDGRVEGVTLVVREGALIWTCTDGTAGREGSLPSSPFVRAALRWVAAGAGDGAEAARGDARAARPSSPGAEEAPSSSGSAAAPSSVELGRKLGSALEDLVTAVARAGTAGRESPSVREGIDRVARTITPTPTMLARWIARLERAMAAGDARLVARLLDGAARASDDLARAQGGPIARARAAAWRGEPSEESVERVVDRAMIEIAREPLESSAGSAGTQRAGIERRYLMDLATGEVLCEERARGDGKASLGPCPRSIFVGLGEVEEGAAPRRVRVLQYTVTIEPSAAELERVLANAVRRSSVLVDAYREAVTAWPAFAEPVMVIACAGTEGGLLVDAVGEPIPIARDEDPGAAAALDARVARAGAPEWIAGRLIDVEGAVRMVPCSVGGGAGVVRLR